MSVQNPERSFQPNTIENKPLIIQTAEQLTQELEIATADYFSPLKVADDIKRGKEESAKHGRHTAWGRFMGYDADPDFDKAYHAEWERIRKPDVDTVVLGSFSDQKRRTVEDIAARYGLVIKYPTPSRSMDEKYMHSETLYSIDGTPSNIPPARFALHIAGLKASRADQEHEGFRLKRDPYIGADVCVIAGNTILNKPSTTDEAKNQLAKISGQTITIISSIIPRIVTYSGEHFVWLGGTAIRFPLRNLTPEEQETYIREQGEKMLYRSGSIDYREEQGKQLIRNDVPLQVLPFELGTGNMAPWEPYTEEDWIKKSVSFSKDALPALDSHLSGIPLQQTDALLRNMKAVYKHN